MYKPVVHYPRDGITYMRGHCGQHSVSSTKILEYVTCQECRDLVGKPDFKPLSDAIGI